MKAVALIFLVACTDLPAQPSFQQDVAPILAANCGRCHGGPTIGGAPDDMRVTYPVAAMVRGAIRIRVVDERSMPPRWELDDDQLEIIKRWTEPGADPRGEPRPGNRAPQLDIASLGRNESGMLVYGYSLYDPDGDLVGGWIEADGQRVSVAMLHQGRDIVAIDSSAVQPGMYTLVAVFDDGGVETRVDIDTVRLP